MTASRPISRRRLLQAGSLGAAALLLGEACGSSVTSSPSPSPAPAGSPTPPPSPSPTATPAPTPAPALGGGELMDAAYAASAGPAYSAPGGAELAAADLKAAAELVAGSDTALVGGSPVAALGYLLAAVDWSGAAGAIGLSRFFPGLEVAVARLPLAGLPGGKPTAVIADAIPPGLTVRAGAALLIVALAPEGSLLVAVDDPARPVAKHPRLEIGVVPAAGLAPLLAAAGARLDASGAVALADGTSIALRTMTAELAAQLVAAAGLLFVDRAPVQPKGAKTSLLTTQPIVRAPDAVTVPGFSSVSQAKDGRVLGLDAGGKAIGRAQYIGGDVAWNWLGADGLDLTLRELADRIGWHVGTEKGDFHDSGYRAVDVAQCNLVTIGTYWFEIEPEPGQFNLSIIGGQLDDIAPYGFRVRAHPILDNGSDVPWLAKLSKAEIRDVLVRHVSTLMDRYRGTVHEWVVTNEPYLPPYRPVDPFHAALGYGYIDLAFETARKADPAAVLIYNDTDNHHADGLTTALTRETVRRLHKKGLVDMVGLQMHLDGSYPPSRADVVATMRSYGVPVAVTEFDIDLSTVKGTTAERFAVQARIAASMLRAIRESGVCKSFTLWGLGDPSSWLVRSGNPHAAPTPFDDDLKPKPFLAALLRGLA